MTSIMLSALKCDQTQFMGRIVIGTNVIETSANRKIVIETNAISTNTITKKSLKTRFHLSR